MKVSVLMITYNHEEFIAQALDSVLMQQVDFDYEIVIGEDCSNDDTRKILVEYKNKFPDKIRLLLPKKNLGMMRNFVNTFRECHGEYIAILEGDDLWISPRKLQKQADFLDHHPDFSSCFHNVTVLAAGKETICHNSRKMHKEYCLKDIVAGNFIHTCSVVYRNGGLLPEWFESMPMGDWPTHVLNAERGPIGYLDEVMATYRVHDGGGWSTMKRYEVLQASKRAALVIDSHLRHAYSNRIVKQVALWELEMATLMAEEKNLSSAFRHLTTAAAFAPFYPKLYKRMIKNFIPAVLK